MTPEPALRWRAVTAPLRSLLDTWHKDLDPHPPGRVVVPPPARALLLAATAQRRSEPVLAIVAGEREAEDLVDDVALRPLT